MKKVLKGFEEDFEMIERNGRNLLNLSQQILDLSKLEAKQLPIHLQQQDLVVYIKYLLESFHPITTAKGMNINFNAVPGTLFMDFDEDKVRMILSNLISNAIKFSEPDTDIEVSLSLECAESEQVKIKVTDHGIGIPADHVPRVFDRYFQVEQHRIRHEEGSGLGLALTWELVKLLGGKITLQSEVNIGSSFSFWLPVTRNSIIKQPLFDLEPFADEEEITLETGVPVCKHAERLKLLLVEDNSDVISYMKSVLTQYEIYTAENGKTGFEYAIDLIPDLVISDVMMPLEDGFSLCKRLKEDLRTSHIPVILLTARADQSSRLVGLDAGADAYLEKPFDPEELELRIRKLTALRKTLQKRYSGMIFGFPLSLPKNPAFAKEDRFMEKFVQSIDNHMVDEEFGIDTLCNDLAMSRSKLYRKFSALTNLTVHQFIRKFKLNRSQHLLRTTNLNVSEVAFHTGFKNLSHFSRIYTEEFGFSPQKEKKDKAGIPTQ
jgi:CheY-like chemotaxis protein/two-component sensor histidine kinase